MRHLNNTCKLNRTSSHRRCMFANMLKSLINHGRIETTVPKAKALRKLNPVAFVDDYAPYFSGVEQKIHKALLLRECNGSPNVGDNLSLVDSTHTNLLKFSKWWIGQTKREDGA